MTDKPISQLARERKLDRVIRSIMARNGVSRYQLAKNFMEVRFTIPGASARAIRQAFNTDKG